MGFNILTHSSSWFNFLSPTSLVGIQLMHAFAVQAAGVYTCSLE